MLLWSCFFVMDKKKKSVWKTIKKDIQDSSKSTNITFDYFDTLDYYLSKEQKERLKKMSFLKKCFYIPIWLFKILFFKLTPGRRIVFVVSMALLISRTSRYDYSPFGIVLIIFLLLLELKDKLIAKDELKAGHAVQMAFMPEQSPIIPGYQVFLFTKPANNVGGDMIDYIQLNDTTYGIAIADISGKELGAALHMVKLQAILRTVVSDFKSLSKLGEKINTIFCRDTGKKRFASMLYLELSTKSNKVRFVNAGHFPPIKVSQNNIVTFSKGQAALGLSKGIKYKEQQLELNSGEVVILYSDGVTEAMNTKGQFFNETRLNSIVKHTAYKTASEIGAIILKEVKDFVGSAKIHDDLSLVVIKKD